jgi:hypothetical protein
VEHCGGIDILVSNAAVNPFFGNIMDSTAAVWDKVRYASKHLTNVLKSNWTENLPHILKP